jgi:transcriptional regulator with XRE-family HTH domain
MSKQVSMNVATSFVTIVSLMKTRPSEQLWKAFGEWIKDIRENQRHLSQDGVADRAGLDRQTIYRLEAGKSGTRRETVIAIANALSVDPNLALKKAGFGNPDASDKPQNALEFVTRLREMGFEIQTDFDYEKLGPDALQDIVDDIEAKLIYKTRRMHNK